MALNPSEFYVNGSDFPNVKSDYNASSELKGLLEKLKENQKEKHQYIEKFFNMAINDKVKNYSEDRFKYYANVLIKWFIENAEKHYGTKDISDLASYVSSIKDTELKDGITSEYLKSLTSQFKTTILEAIDEQVRGAVASSPVLLDDKTIDETIKRQEKATRITSYSDENGLYEKNKKKFETAINFKAINSSIEKNIYNKADRIRLDLPAPIARLHLFLNRREPRNLTLSQKIGKMMPKSIRMINYKFIVFESIVANFSIKGIAYQLRRFSRLMGKKLLNVVSIVIPIKSMMAIFKGVRATLKFVSNQISRIVRFASRIKRFVLNLGTKTYLFLKKSYLAIAKYTLTTDIFKAFFKTYLGAFFLGYAIGFIYKKTRGIVETAKNWFAYALEKTVGVRERIEKILDFAIDKSNNLFQFVFDLFDEIRFGDDEGILSMINEINNDLRSGTTGAKIDAFKPFEVLEDVSEWIIDTFEDIDMDDVLRNMTLGIGKTLTSVAGSVAGAAIGSAIGALGGPFAPLTVPLGGIVGSFVGGYGGEKIGEFLFGKKFDYKKKKSPLENPYNNFVSRTFRQGKTIDVPDLKEFAKTADGKFNVTTKFGFAYSEIQKAKRQKEKGGTVDYSFLDRLGFQEYSVEQRSAIADFLDKSSKVLTHKNIVKELNATLKILTEELRDNTDLYGGANDYGNTFLHVDPFKSTIEDMIGFSKPKATQQEVLMYRLYRAYVFGNLLPLLQNGVLSPKEFYDAYKSLEEPKHRVTEYGARFPFTDKTLKYLNKSQQTYLEYLVNLPFIKYHALSMPNENGQILAAQSWNSTIAGHFKSYFMKGNDAEILAKKKHYWLSGDPVNDFYRPESIANRPRYSSEDTKFIWPSMFTASDIAAFGTFDEKTQRLSSGDANVLQSGKYIEELFSNLEFAERNAMGLDTQSETYKDQLAENLKTRSEVIVKMSQANRDSIGGKFEDIKKYLNTLIDTVEKSDIDPSILMMINQNMNIARENIASIDAH